MAVDRTQRRLAAILAADVAGYSRLMGADEEGTLAVLKLLRRELADPKIREHRGRIVKTTGDGLLVEFASVVDAVRCAVDVQREMAKRNTAVPAERRIEFRIGINIGDIIIDKKDIYGDGVNVAARIESLDEPGGICVSQVVRDQVRDKLNLSFEDMGEREVKNIARPICVHSIRLTEDAGVPCALSLQPATAKQPTLVDQTYNSATLAVLPISNAGGDPQEQYFNDGVTREVVTALSRFVGLSVIAANSSFRFRGNDPDIDQARRELGVHYVAKISVQRESERVRVSAQLIDAETGARRWAERYDRNVQDVFTVQDEVAERIAAVLVAHVARAERERIARKPVKALKAYEYYLRAVDQSRIWDRSDGLAAEQMLEKAIELAPGFAAAHAALSGYLVSSWLEPKDLRWRTSATLERGWIEARMAVEYDPYLPATHAALDWVQFWKHELESAVSSYRRAQELNPSFADGRQGHVLGIAGLPEEGLNTLVRTRLLDPFHPPMLLGYLGHCHLLLDQPEQALVVLRECAMRAPGWRPAHVWRAAACVLLHLDAEARTAAAEVIGVASRFTVSDWQQMHGYRDAQRAAVIAQSLVRAGLPKG